MNINSLDWDRMWKEQSRSIPHSKLSRRETWDKRADRFSKRINGVVNGHEKLNKDDYIFQMLERIEIKPEWSVLDIGCGPGTLTIPLAKKARQVTALDISSEMLKHLKVNAESNCLNNIRYVNSSWEEALANQQVEPHDVVVASRSLMTDNMKDALSLIVRSTRHAAYITYPVIHLPFDWEVYRVIGRRGNKHPPYIYLYNMLYQMGIEANIEMLFSKVEVQFSSYDQAIEELQSRNDPFTLEEIKKFRAYWDIHLKESGAGKPFIHEGQSKWALIWWRNGNWGISGNMNE